MNHESVSELVARGVVVEFLRRRHGEDLTHPKLGPIVIENGSGADLGIAYAFSANTPRYFETRNPLDGLMPVSIIVPKDGTPAHWKPTNIPLRDYIAAVANGERWWSASGAEPETSVRYLGILEPPITRIVGIVRTRTIGESSIDEVFNRNLAWKSTELLLWDKLGHNDSELVEMTHSEAAEFIRRMRAKYGR